MTAYRVRRPLRPFSTQGQLWWHEEPASSSRGGIGLALRRSSVTDRVSKASSSTTLGSSLLDDAVHYLRL